MSISSVRPPANLSLQQENRLALHSMIAYLAASLLTRKVYLLVEVREQLPALFSGEVNNEINLLDIRRNSRITGTFLGSRVQVQDEQTGKKVEFTMTGNTFSGRELISGAAFHGSVDRERVFLFDDEAKSQTALVVRAERSNARPSLMRPALSAELGS